MEHKLIQGGEQFLPFARSRIKALRATGLRYATQRFSIDGVDIGVRIVGDHEYITLIGGKLKILSGVIKGGTVAGTPKKLTAYKPTANAWQYALGSNPLKPVTTFNQESYLARAETQYADLCPTMYSGLMTKAVQIIMGQGLTVAYDYKWVKCHGIVTAADGKFWLLEISSTNGVIAMPLPLAKGDAASLVDVIKQSTILFGGIPSNGKFPTGTVLADAITNGTILRLKTVGDMSAFFGKTPYASTMGWSFNDTGSEAHNTCHDTDGTNFTSYHYKLDITIGATTSTPVAGIPIATATATLSLVSSGYLTTKQLTSGGPYPPLPLYIFDTATNTQNVIPSRQAPFAETDVDADTTVIALHTNGVLGVISIKSLIALDYSYVATGPHFIMTDFTVAEHSTPAGRYVRYPGVPDAGLGFTYDRIGYFSLDTTNTSGGSTYTAWTHHKIERTKLNDGFVVWGARSRDNYSVFQPEVTLVVTDDYAGFQFNDAGYAGGAGGPEDLFISDSILSSTSTTVTIGMPTATVFPKTVVTTTVKPVSFHLGYGTQVDIDDDSTLWDFTFPRVTYSVFGDIPNAAFTFPTYHRSVGALLAAEPTTPQDDTFCFIGYT